MDASHATSSCFYWFFFFFFCPQLYNRGSALCSGLNRVVWRASVSHKSGKAFWLIRMGFLSTDFGSPSGGFCVTTEWTCTKARVCVFLFSSPSSYVFQVIELKTKKQWHKTFPCTVQQATTQALTNLFGFDPWISSPTTQLTFFFFFFFFLIGTHPHF